MVHRLSNASTRRRDRQFDDPSVDLVLLDLMLPDADGVGLFRELRARRLGGLSPVKTVRGVGYKADVG